MNIHHPGMLMKWRQFVYFKQGISAKDFKKEKLSDILMNIEMFEAMENKVKRLQKIEDMRRAAMGK